MTVAKILARHALTSHYIQTLVVRICEDVFWTIERHGSIVCLQTDKTKVPVTVFDTIASCKGENCKQRGEERLRKCIVVSFSWDQQLKATGLDVEDELARL